ncbi:MAG: nickel pincer cofactor biosynthesis protein LarC [Methanosarcinaceae archaeon]|nr:nickel pincer cofactor biosynthesis protein LarC [Methanosarcinaceae archaeon]
MRVLYFEPFSGASGDMILGALADLGASSSFMESEILKCTDVSVSFKKVIKGGISSTKAEVSIPKNKSTDSKTYFEIKDLIKASSLNEQIKSDVLSVFEIMAKAESSVHGIPIDKIHFHEVGQDDAIADVVGACAGLYDLNEKKETKLNFDLIKCGVINTGSGFVKSAHGTLPVPAPATLEILKQSGLYFQSFGKGELLTPTGAALLSHFTNRSNRILSKNSEIFGTFGKSSGKILKIGYGAGNLENKLPNVLRLSLVDFFDFVPPSNISETLLFSKIKPQNFDSSYLLETDSIDILETNVDDVTGEILGNLSQKLFKSGAKDVSIHPIFMKKGRPGHMIRIISEKSDTLKLAEILILETGTLGVRVISDSKRIKVQREIKQETVELNGKIYEIPIKIAYDSRGKIINVSAEYENCKQISNELDIPLKEIIQFTEQKAKTELNKKQEKK